MSTVFDELIDAASRPYLAAGRATYHFVRGKLRHDPFFLELLRTRRIAEGARVLDLGCGHAIVASLLLAARARFEAGQWPESWPIPPADPQLYGLDSARGPANCARMSLGERATIEISDVREAQFPSADLILIIDVLHYMNAGEQDRVLDKAVAALRPGGSLVLRIANPSAGWKFLAGRAADHFGYVIRGLPPPRHHHRQVDEWRSSLGARGLDARVEPLLGKASFANVLLQADA
ncbi:MAG TPA: class I SAM-dependent methyltransferase [Burkholderiales bacterium]|nr:class I SAM-dependent methyltransferase [Burkholderiales bacterium]